MIDLYENPFGNLLLKIREKEAAASSEPGLQITDRHFTEFSDVLALQLLHKALPFASGSHGIRTQVLPR
jgi:hypothetical protein